TYFVGCLVRRVLRLRRSDPTLQVAAGRRIIVRDRLPGVVLPKDAHHATATRNRDLFNFPQRAKFVIFAALDRERLGPVTVEAFALIGINFPNAFLTVRCVPGVAEQWPNLVA